MTTTARPEVPEMANLFSVYTADPQSIGSALTRTEYRSRQRDPLIVATSFDIALYPGQGKTPQVEGFRVATRGFNELAGVSHLGPAVASLVSLHERAGDDAWRAPARRLISATERARAVNTVDLWRDIIAVQAFRGREQRISQMYDYACASTVRYLRRALAAEDGYLCRDSLQRDYLGSVAGGAYGPALINEMMVATFFLVGLDNAYRLLRWFGSQHVDWARAMVIVAGRQGRPTAGVTWTTSSVATMLRGASEYRLPLHHMYIAPHAPTFSTPQDGDLSDVTKLEEPLRLLWANIHATQELGDTMFPGYPRFTPVSVAAPDVSDPAVTEVSEMPLIRDADDFRAMVTRLRVVLEDPRQLLSACVTDFAVAQLVQHDNDPTKVTVPGLDNIDYPTVDGDGPR
jgi:hypothetical protein